MTKQEIIKQIPSERLSEIKINITMPKYNSDVTTIDILSLAFLGMLLTPIPCLDILGRFDSDTQLKMLDNLLSDNELKELAESKGETFGCLKNAVKEFKYLFNI